MSEIDWSKAPDGATHFDPSDDGMNMPWVKLSKERFYCWEDDIGWHGPLNSNDYFFNDGNVDRLIPRPTKTEWVDGLPPVGCECEMKHGGTANYVDVLIIGYYDTPWGDNGKAVVVKCPSLFPDESDYVSPINIDSGLHFRPLQTPEQRQREELANDISIAAVKADTVLDLHESDTIADAILSKYNLTEK